MQLPPIRPSSRQSQPETSPNPDQPQAISHRRSGLKIPAKATLVSSTTSPATSPHQQANGNPQTNEDVMSWPDTSGDPNAGGDGADVSPTLSDEPAFMQRSLSAASMEVHGRSSIGSEDGLGRSSRSSSSSSGPPSPRAFDPDDPDQEVSETKSDHSGSPSGTPEPPTHLGYRAGRKNFYDYPGGRFDQPHGRIPLMRPTGGSVQPQSSQESHSDVSDHETQVSSGRFAPSHKAGPGLNDDAGVFNHWGPSKAPDRPHWARHDRSASQSTSGRGADGTARHDQQRPQHRARIRADMPISAKVMKEPDAK